VLITEINMIVHDVVQGSSEWLQCRAGIPTASELNKLITPAKRQLSTGDGVQTYIAEKVAERWLGRPLESFSGGVLEQGSILEQEAIPWLEKELKCDLYRPFLTTDDGRFGCSPDAMIEPPSDPMPTSRRPYGFEIKCPQPTNHVRWLLESEGSCPREHFAQVQGGMYVTGAPVWRFISYSAVFPKLIVDVPRDEKFQELIHIAVTKAASEIERKYAELVDRNGGPPKRRVPPPPPVTDDDPFAVNTPDRPIDFKAGVKQ